MKIHQSRISQLAISLGLALLCPWLSSAVAAAPPPTAEARTGSTDNPELAAFKKAIRAKYDMKERAFAAGDADTIVNKFYTEDEITVAAGDKIYFGRKDIRPEYEKDVGHNKVKIDSVATFVAGDAGWDWADFHVYPTDGKTQPFTFAILFLWARINGEWMCKGDFFDYGSFRTGKLVPPPAPAGK